eukprot:PITA_22422
MDVKTTFLNKNIEEEVYIEQREGFETFDRESHVCRLRRALYGLKQAPCAWYTMINSYCTDLSFTKSEADVYLYHIMVEGKTLIIVLYVDDLILKGDDQLIQFEMEDMGLMHYFLGMELIQAMVQPTKLFWKAAKHVLRYLRCTSQFGLWYRWTEGVKLQCFIDADWAGNPSDWKSTSGGIFNLGSTTVSWYNMKQRSVALSSAEAEYMAASQAACEGI